MKCVICGNEIMDSPHSAYPLAEGVCCYECYLTSVISAEGKNKYQRIASVDRRMFDKRFGFVSRLTAQQAKDKLQAVVKSAVKCLFYLNEWGLNISVLRKLGVQLTDEEKRYLEAPFSSEEARGFCKALVDDMCKDDESCARALMLYTYAFYYDAEDRTNWAPWGDEEFEVTENTELLYEFLENLGYVKSEEEKKWYDGTHVVYLTPDKEQKDES